MRVNLQVGRTRKTNAVSPRESRYIASMNAQMSQLSKALEEVIRNIEGESEGALKYAAQPIYDMSQKLVPKDTHELQQSGFMEVRRNTRGVSLSMGYGRGGNPFYAVYVHERLDLAHANGTSAKYLEYAIKAKLHLVPGRYARYMKKNAGLSD